MPHNDAMRVFVLDALLREVGIPIVGISVQSVTPTVDVTIQYAVEATAEQIALGQQMLEAFDWRARRKLSRSTVVTALGQLTTQQQNAIMRHLICDALRNNPSLSAQIDAALGTSLPVEEVDPS